MPPQKKFGQQVNPKKSYLRPIAKHLCPPPAHIIRYRRRFPQGTSFGRIRVTRGSQTRARTPTACVCVRVPPLLPSPADLRPAFLLHHSATHPIVSGHGPPPCGGTSNNTHNVPPLPQLFILNSQFSILHSLTPSPPKNATPKPA